MAFFKTTLPRLRTKKELQYKRSGLANETLSTDEYQTEESLEVRIPEGLLFYISSKNKDTVLAIAAFELTQMLLNLLEKIQGLSSDGMTALPLQLYPHFEQEEGKLAFRLLGDEALLEKTFFLVQKMKGHLNSLKNTEARVQQIPPSWSLAYRQFFGRLKQYQQSIQLVDSSNGSLLFSIASEDCERLIQGLEHLKGLPQKVSLAGRITGFSQNKRLIDFQISTKEWNGIRIKKAIDRPISCKASKNMIAFAKQYMDELVEFEALLYWDESANKHYQLQSILLKTASGVIKERIIYKGPRGGAYYLSYMGKKVYLPRAKRS